MCIYLYNRLGVWTYRCGWIECVCMAVIIFWVNYSFTSPRRSGDGQIRLNRDLLSYFLVYPREIQSGNIFNVRSLGGPSLGSRKYSPLHIYRCCQRCKSSESLTEAAGQRNPPESDGQKKRERLLVHLDLRRSARIWQRRIRVESMAEEGKSLGKVRSNTHPPFVSESNPSNLEFDFSFFFVFYDTVSVSVRWPQRGIMQCHEKMHRKAEAFLYKLSLVNILEYSCRITWGIINKNIRGPRKPVYSFQPRLQGSPPEVSGATPKTVAPKLVIHYIYPHQLI